MCLKSQRQMPGPCSRACQTHPDPKRVVCPAVFPAKGELPVVDGAILRAREEATAVALERWACLQTGEPPENWMLFWPPRPVRKTGRQPSTGPLTSPDSLRPRCACHLATGPRSGCRWSTGRFQSQPLYRPPTGLASFRTRHAFLDICAYPVAASGLTSRKRRLSAFRQAPTSVMQENLPLYRGGEELFGVSQKCHFPPPRFLGFGMSESEAPQR